MYDIIYSKSPTTSMVWLNGLSWRKNKKIKIRQANNVVFFNTRFYVTICFKFIPTISLACFISS